MKTVTKSRNTTAASGRSGLPRRPQTRASRQTSKAHGAVGESRMREQGHRVSGTPVLDHILRNRRVPFPQPRGVCAAWQLLQKSFSMISMILLKGARVLGSMLVALRALKAPGEDRSRRRLCAQRATRYLPTSHRVLEHSIPPPASTRMMERLKFRALCRLHQVCTKKDAPALFPRTLRLMRPGQPSLLRMMKRQSRLLTRPGRFLRGLGPVRSPAIGLMPISRLEI